MIPRFSALRTMRSTGAILDGLPISCVLWFVHTLASILGQREHVVANSVACAVEAAKGDAGRHIDDDLAVHVPMRSLLAPGVDEAVAAAALAEFVVDRAVCVLWLTPALLDVVRSQSYPKIYAWICWRRQVPSDIRDLMIEHPSAWE